MGGLGKTTLARLIYNDEQIVRYFDERIWVCVSEIFDVNKIIRLVLESLTQRSIDVQSRNALLQILHKELGGRKYLLVLDDVWNEKLEEWDDFKRSLVGINATKGNAIIVTTRSERVASIVATHHLHFLEKLSEDDCWSVFKERAFPEGDVPMELVPIGKQIAHKCSGLPLAANLLGGMLRLTKENIYKLIFQWSSGRQDIVNDDSVLGGLEPHPNLKSLTVQNFMGDKLPTWIMTMMVSTIEGHLLGLDNLVEIKLKGCRKCEELPMLGHLPHLKYLDLTGLDNLKSISRSFYGRDFLRSRTYQGDNTNIASFRSLKRLVFCNMPNLVEWTEPEEVTTEKVFPHLEEIEIHNCSQITTTPCSFPSLEELRISNVSSYQPLENICSSDNSSGLTFLHIDGLLELACLPDNLLNNIKNLVYLAIYKCPNLVHVVPRVRGFGSFLRVLDIKECTNLSTLPDDLQTLQSLAMLWISRCPKITSIPSLEGLTTLEELRISYCDELASLPNEMLLSCMSLKSLSIENCVNLTSFPNLQQLNSLLSLRIVDCPQLTCLPKVLHSLS
ncbi:hypothetical protein MTR67_007603 [Solanum verrucosum]|uniref:NB-ARC domain-containing protein n=1 Tax=Solanum verrucosum TaxID=315347 RepID=A0AAF0Q089_SOLVR|nr:hypothetical protein MTR67_007603 [Solanum verrucosum]